MNEIYEILSKHFSGKANSLEEEKAANFQKENPKEYLLLSKLWKSEPIVVKDYDENTAWKKLRPESARSKRIRLYQRIASVAAVALLLIGTTVFLYKTTFHSPTPFLVFQTTATESNKEIKLADGSIVYLNKGSKLFYPEQFSGESREVKLEGEAFFEITKNKAKPFIITTTHSEVEVLGTSFNVSTNIKNTTVTVATGQVKVQSLFNEQSALLSKNESCITNKKEITKSIVSDNNYLAWKTGAFFFDETPIAEVVDGLNTYYNKQILLHNRSSECKLTASFNKSDIEDVLKVIQLSCHLKLTQKNIIYELH